MSIQESQLQCEESERKEELPEIYKKVYNWHSPSVNRNMELTVLGHSGARVLLFPSRTGRHFDFEDWNIHKYIRDKIANGWLQFFCLDSIDAESFYCWWAEPQGRIQRHLQYEKYIIDEVLPMTRHLNPDMTMVSAGYSMGAFHAMNIALRHPHHFGKVLAMSGRYSLTDEFDGFMDLLSGYRSDDVYFSNPCHYLPNMPEGHQLHQIRQLEITMVIGNEDPFLQNNLYLADVMTKKGVPHHLWRWDGHAHTGYYWRRMLKAYL